MQSNEMLCNASYATKYYEQIYASNIYMTGGTDYNGGAALLKENQL